jgi:hypothetical protein
MEKVLTRTRKTVSENKLLIDIDVIAGVNNITNQNHDYDAKRGSGACTVPGCGCPQFKNSEGTCFNLNSSGGTCNHLASNHQ